MGLIASIITVFYGPGATGSGISQIIGYVMGVNYPMTINLKTLVTKILGVIFAVSASLCLGKEGPLAHIGANLGALTLYFLDCQKFLRNDHKRRHFIAAGASAGVSVAFGAPIGGALFIFENTKASTFWKFSLLWKTFFSCSIAVATLAFLEAAIHGHFESWTASTVKFGKVKVADISPSDVLPGAIILGIVSGLLGSLFININTRVNRLRTKKRWLKPFDTVALCVVTASCFYWSPYLMQSCVPSENGY